MLVRFVFFPATEGLDGAKADDDALAHLRERFARGEIEEEIGLRGETLRRHRRE